MKSPVSENDTASLDSNSSADLGEQKPFLYQESTATIVQANETSAEEEAPPEKCRILSTIFFVSVLFIVIVICYADRVNMSVASIPMSQQFNWTNTTQGAVMSSFFVGYVVTQIPSGYLGACIGGEFILLVGMIIWSVFTIITPFTASITPILFIARAGMGIGEGTAFPAVHSLISQYSKKNERSILVTTITSGSYLGSVVALLICPLLIVHWSWQSIFYVFGAAGIVYLIIYIPFIIFWRVRARKQQHSKKKVEIVEVPVTQTRGQVILAKLSILKQIFFSPAAWCIFIGQFCNSYGFYFMLSWLPTYYKSQFGTDISDLGYFTMLPFAIQG